HGVQGVPAHRVAEQPYPGCGVTLTRRAGRGEPDYLEDDPVSGVQMPEHVEEDRDVGMDGFRGQAESTGDSLDRLARQQPALQLPAFQVVTSVEVEGRGQSGAGPADGLTPGLVLGHREAEEEPPRRPGPRVVVPARRAFLLGEEVVSAAAPP